MRDTMLAQGRADASASFATTAFLALTSFGVPASDIVTMRYVAYGLDLYGVRPDGQRGARSPSAPRLLAGVARAVAHGVKDALARPEDAVASIRKRDPLLNEAIELSASSWVAKQSMVTDSVRRLGLGAAEPERLTRTIGFVAEAFKVANPPPARRHLYRRVPAAPGNAVGRLRLGPIGTCSACRHCERSEAIQRASGASSRSLSSGRPSAGPVGSSQ
ncbi:MAG: hypothetical protein WDO24_13270 [Pseudomonadota bacterium]